MKAIQKPKFTQALDELTTFIADERIEYARFSQCTIDLSEVCHFDSCIFDHYLFINGNDHLDFLDCIFDHCDLSNAECENSFFHRVQFEHCKMIGISLLQTGLQHTTFNNCLMNMSQLFSSQPKKLPDERMPASSSQFYRYPI